MHLFWIEIIQVYVVHIQPSALHYISLNYARIDDDLAKTLFIICVIWLH